MPLPSMACYHHFIGTMGSCHPDAPAISCWLEALAIISLGIFFRASFVPCVLAFHIALISFCDPPAILLSVVGGRRTYSPYRLYAVICEFQHINCGRTRESWATTLNSVVLKLRVVQTKVPDE